MGNRAEREFSKIAQRLSVLGCLDGQRFPERLHPLGRTVGEIAGPISEDGQQGGHARLRRIGSRDRVAEHETQAQEC